MRKDKDKEIGISKGVMVFVLFVAALAAFNLTVGFSTVGEILVKKYGEWMWGVYYVDPTNADQGATGNGNTIKALATTIDTSKRATLRFANIDIESGNTTAYTVSTALDLSSYPHLQYDVENGAMIVAASGVTVTIYSPANIIAQPNQHIFSGNGTVSFLKGTPGEVSPGYWGGDPTGLLDSAAAINAAESSGAHHINMKGKWGVSSPIFLTRQLTVFDGGSRIGSEIYALAADISTGAYPNALIVNKINAWDGTLKSIRFPNNGVNWTGWVISAYEGASGGVEQAMLSGHLYDLWVDPGTLATGFFRGGFYDSWAHDIQFENIKIRFDCDGTPGNSMSGAHIYAISESTTLGELVKAVNSSRTVIFGITSYGTNDGYLINLTDSADFNISDINADAIAANGPAGLLTLSGCTNIKVDNVSLNRTSGSMSGVSVVSSELKLANGKIKGVSGTALYPIYISGVSNDVNIDNLTVDTSQLYQIATSNAGGSLVINNSKFTNGGLAILTNLGTDTLDVTIQGSKLLNSDTESMLIYATSGDVKLINNDIGIDDGVSTATYLFYFTGSGKVIMGGNNIVGAASAGEFHPSNSQNPTYVGPNPDSTANPIKVGQFTIDTATASGTHAVTGVGFKPKYLEFHAVVGGATEFSTGFDDGTVHNCVASYHAVSANTWLASTDYSIYLVQGPGITYTGVVTTLGSDGFTITWTKTGAKTGTAYINYTARAF